MLRMYMAFGDMRTLDDAANACDVIAMLAFMVNRGCVEVTGEFQGGRVIWRTERAVYHGASAASLGLAFRDCVRAALMPPECLPAAGLPGVVEYPGKEG